MYEKREYKVGDIIEVEKTHSKKCPPKGAREKRSKPTAESVKKYNDRKAEDYIRRKFHCNFCADDLHIVLAYPKSYRPSSAKAKKDLMDFKRCMRKEYKKLDMKFKYMHVTGFYDKDGIPESGYDEHDETSVHHHIIMNAIDYKIITGVWRKLGGRIWFYPLDDEGDYTALVNYFIGHTKNLFREERSPCKQKWSCSRNLIEPPPPVVEEISATSWRDYPVAKKGYKIVTDSIKQGVSEITGYPYQFYRMVRIKDNRHPSGKSTVLQSTAKTNKKKKEKLKCRKKL